MASQFPPKKNTAFTLYFTLYKNDGTIIANPGTITKKIFIDGGTVADITNAVTEVNTTYGLCSVVLTSSEMNGDSISVYIVDNTTGCVPFTATLYTAARLVDDLAYPTTTGRSIDVTTTGEVGIDWANIGSPTTTVNLSGTTVKTATDVETDTADIQGRLPAALVSGRIDASVGAMAANTITSTAIQDGAITEAKVADDVKVDLNTIKGQTVTCAGGVTIPAATLASTTNITAGTITTATNLTNLPAIPTDWLTASGLAADAVTEIVTGILSGTITELAAVPGASPSLKDAVALLYMALRNKRDTTSSADTITNDAGTTIATASLSDNGTTFTKAEYV